MSLNQIIFLILRRMRAPLLMVIISYAIALIGFVLIPGGDDHGQPYHFSFFDAFYILSYTATTIGFGEHLAMRLNALGTYLLHEWLTRAPGDAIATPAPVPQGHWIACGFGRFGKSVVSSLQNGEMHVTIIEADPQGTQCEDCIIGSGVESHILQQAGVEHAVGIVAGTDNDINNLSIVMTALELNPKLFVIIRKNKRHNDPLFQHFNADITMQPSDVIAHTCLSYMVSPMLAEFLVTARHQGNAWANAVIAQLVSKLGEQVPDTWDITIADDMAVAVCALMEQGIQPALKHLMMRPAGQQRHEMPVVPLMLVRGEQKMLLPELSTPLQIGDTILCCGLDQAKSIQRFVMHDIKTLHYLVTGTEMPETWIGRWLKAGR